ncbi:unnamed protein product [Ixodes pacificus]
MSEESEYRMRLVTLGGGGVGKSSIVKRFLFNTYTDRYKPTVEDLFCKEFDLDTMTLKVDILDTAGDHQFPAMRRLSIANGHAFLLVYSLDSLASFRHVKQCFEEIREQKADFQEVPIVVVGNKLDLSEDRRQVSKEDVAEWLFCELPRLRAKFMECSAKDNVNIREVFRAFLQLSRIPLASEQAPALQRRCSARVTGLRTRGFSSTSLQRDQSSSTGGGESSLQKSSSGSTALDGFGVQKAKPRSRSLIRRTSKKAKLKDPAAGDDCTVS